MTLVGLLVTMPTLFGFVVLTQDKIVIFSGYSTFVLEIGDVTGVLTAATCPSVCFKRVVVRYGNNKIVYVPIIKRYKQLRNKLQQFVNFV